MHVGTWGWAEPVGLSSRSKRVSPGLRMWMGRLRATYLWRGPRPQFHPSFEVHLVLQLFLFILFHTPDRNPANRHSNRLASHR